MTKDLTTLPPGQMFTSDDDGKTTLVIDTGPLEALEQGMVEAGTLVRAVPLPDEDAVRRFVEHWRAHPRFKRFIVSRAIGGLDVELHPIEG